MQRLYLDLESYSECPLPKTGSYRYAEDPTTEILMIGYAVDDSPAVVWDRTTGTAMPLELGEALRDSEIVVFNAGFERPMLGHCLGLNLPETRFHDVQAKGLGLGYPSSLSAMGAALHLPAEQAKMKSGGQLLNRFSMPAPSNHKAHHYDRYTHPEEWEMFIDYCRQDVEAMRIIDELLPNLNYKGREKDLWFLDQRINDLGVPFDTEFAKAAQQAFADEQTRNIERVRYVTAGVVDSPAQIAAMRDYLAQLGCIVPDMTKGSIAEALKTATGTARELLLCRRDYARTNAKKYTSMLMAACADGRIRGTQQYCGAARTGRQSGRITQFQNIARPTHSLEEIEDGIEATVGGYVDLVAENVSDLLVSCIRATIRAAPGKRLVVADLSNIEGRVLAWLAGEDWKVKAFADFDRGIGHDMYKASYAKAFGCRPEDVTKDQRQLVGKPMELGFGYGGAVGAFRKFAPDSTFTDKEIVYLVRKWRAANSNIKNFWYTLENSAKRAWRQPGMKVQVGYLTFLYSAKTKALVVRKPSGICLYYDSFQVDDDSVCSFMGLDQTSRKWERIETYSGKIAENVTQSCARDILTHGMLKADERGLPIVMTVHDEIVCETDGDELEALIECMTDLPDWAEGLPLAATGYVADRYRK